MIDAFSKLKLLRMGSKREGDTVGRWQKSCESEVKINVDGSSICALMRAGAGCVMRDNHS